MDIISNPHIVVPFLAFVITQGVKLLLKARAEGFDWKIMFATGNMPSSHSAIVMSLLVILYLVDGPSSAEFGIGAVVASIVIYDSLNVRRAVGEQGGTLSRLVDFLKIPKKQRKDFALKQVLGHNPIEVLVGSLIGLVSGLVFGYNYWSQEMKDFLNDMGDLEISIYYGFFALVFVLGIIINRYYSRRKYKKLPTSKKAKRISTNMMINPAIVGLFVVWLQSQHIRFFTTKFWIFIVIIWIVIGSIYGYFKVLARARLQLEEEASYFSKVKKTLRKTRRKKSKGKK